MKGRATAVALPALAVLGLVAVVAIAAGGSLAPGSNVSRPPSHTLLDAVFTLFLIVLLFGAILTLYGLMQRKEIARELASGKHKRRTVLAYAVYFGVVVAFSYWRLAHLNLRPEGALPGDAGPGATQSVDPNAQASPSYRPGISWLSVIVVLGLVAVACMAYVNAERRARRARVREPGLAELLGEVLDEALDDLRAEADPRRAVIAAYARTERVLAANGIPPRHSETPEEYLRRALEDLGPRSGAIERLTELYTRAKFSQHEVRPAMKDEAIAALEQMRDELRLRTEHAPAPLGRSAAGAAT